MKVIVLMLIMLNFISFLSFGKQQDGAKKPQSMASNYKIPFQISVDDRTGQASMSLKLNSVPGVVPFNSINLAILYDGLGQFNDDQPGLFLGLPQGWRYQIDYISHDDGPTKLHLADGTSYNTNWNSSSESHLQYYKLKNLVLYQLNNPTVYNNQDAKSVLHKNLNLTKVSKEQKLKNNISSNVVDHRYLLEDKLNHTKEYFSPTGLPLSKIDSYGNQIVYHYEKDQKKTISSTPLENPFFTLKCYSLKY